MDSMSDVGDADKFAESGRFGFHTTNDREGVERKPTASDQLEAEADNQLSSIVDCRYSQSCFNRNCLMRDLKRVQRLGRLSAGR